MALPKSPFIHFFALFCLLGCQEYDPYMGGVNASGNLKPESEYFNFNTTADVTFSIDYGKMGSRALIEISADDPTTMGADGEIHYSDNAIFKIFCDKDGRFEGKVTLPTYADSVYIYTMRAGLPTLTRAKVKDGRVEMKLDYGRKETRGWLAPDIDYGTWDEADKFDVIATNGDYTIWKAPTWQNADNIYTIVNWEGSRFGQVIKFDKDDSFYYWGNDFEGGDNQGLINDGDFGNPYDIDKIQYFLWGGKTIKPDTNRGGTFDNEKYARDASIINTIIPTKEELEKLGETDEALDGVEVLLTFISEAALNQNAIGYYYYKTGETPSAPDIIYIAIPNASIGEEKPFVTYTDDSYKMYEAIYAPIAPNKRVQLLYYDKEAKTISKKFPLGYTIGYFIASAETKPNAHFNPMTNNTMKIYDKYQWLIFYSNSEFNSDKKRRFIALNYKEDVIYGMEDGNDGSYEDILFTIETNPKDIAVSTDRDKFDIDKFIVHETTSKLYAFEDIWPDGGDYDMNDVVIEHNHTVFFINGETNGGSNIVTKIEDSFTVRQPYNAATYVDAFAIQLPDDGNYAYSRREIPKNAQYEKDTKSVILFTDAMQELGNTFIVTRYFDGEDVIKEQIPLETTDANGVTINTLNPYIISRYDIEKPHMEIEGRTEIHLPKHKATAKAHTGKIGAGDDAYYINKDGKHPFAISLPMTKEGWDAEWGKHFTHPDGEGVLIDKAYPDFETWVGSNGKEAQDWYMHPAGE